MPVEDTPVHPKTKHDRPMAGCYNAGPPRAGYWVLTRRWCPVDEAYDLAPEFVEHRMSTKCRQTLQLPECEGCTADKDVEYIEKWKEAK